MTTVGIKGLHDEIDRTAVVLGFLF